MAGESMLHFVPIDKSAHDQSYAFAKMIDWMDRFRDRNIKPKRLFLEHTRTDVFSGHPPWNNSANQDKPALKILASNITESTYRVFVVCTKLGKMRKSGRILPATCIRHTTRMAAAVLLEYRYWLERWDEGRRTRMGEVWIPYRAITVHEWMKLQDVWEED
jgi:hypothetical protein